MLGVEYGGGVSEETHGIEELVALRRGKVAQLRAEGVEPFPHAFPGVEPIASVLAAHAGLTAGEETSVAHRVAGRLAARRGAGKAAFLDLVDRSGRIQLHARVDELGEESFERLVSLDLGDLIGVDGVAIATRTGQLSLRVTSFAVLAKSLRPPPDKRHGLSDVETRFRRRELDLIGNEETRALFLARSRIISAVRRALDDDGFIEVETPILQPIYGGALARPFTTHHNALDRTLYLRIATELYLKRCIVGGLERVYELGKDFRNEGLSVKHNPEFTMVEWYEAYADYEDEARRLEAVVGAAAAAVAEPAIDFTAPWRRFTLRAAILEQTGIDVIAAHSLEQLSTAIVERGLELVTEERTWSGLVDDLLSKYVEPTLREPTFIFDYPVELSPFAKAHRSEAGLVERWEAYAGGIEIANAFSELNDPDEQRARFLMQREAAAAGDEEAQPLDEPFLMALEQGMPPTGGVGLGIDRLVMLLLGQRSIREVVLFPALRDA
jgi:lysyl-tRNA synthetase, class II